MPSIDWNDVKLGKTVKSRITATHVLLERNDGGVVDTRKVVDPEHKTVRRYAFDRWLDHLSNKAPYVMARFLGTYDYLWRNVELDTRDAEELRKNKLLLEPDAPLAFYKMVYPKMLTFDESLARVRAGKTSQL